MFSVDIVICSMNINCPEIKTIKLLSVFSSAFFLLVQYPFNRKWRETEKWTWTRAKQTYSENNKSLKKEKKKSVYNYDLILFNHIVLAWFSFDSLTFFDALTSLPNLFELKPIQICSVMFCLENWQNLTRLIVSSNKFHLTDLKIQ